MSWFESPNQRTWLPCFPFRKSVLSPLGTNLLWEGRKGGLEWGRGPSQPPLLSNLWESEWCQPTSLNSFRQSRIPHRKGKGIQLGRRQRCRDKEWHSRLEYIPGGDVRTGSREPRSKEGCTRCLAFFFKSGSSGIPFGSINFFTLSFLIFFSITVHIPYYFCVT